MEYKGDIVFLLTTYNVDGFILVVMYARLPILSCQLLRLQLRFEVPNLFALHGSATLVLKQ